MPNKQKKVLKKEPVFIVKQATRMGGLDYLHISLIVLVIILIGLAFAISYFKPGAIIINCNSINASNSTCARNTTQGINAITLSALHFAIGRAIAGYGAYNTSLALLEYTSLVNQSKIYYINASSEYLAIVPYRDPLDNNKTFNISFIFQHNFTLKSAYISTINPAPTQNSAISYGVVSLAGRYLCNYTKPLPVYYFIDPYVPGFIKQINQSIALQKEYANQIDISYNFLFTQYSASKYLSYGKVPTQRLGAYLTCASQQRKFGSFISNLSIAYQQTPLPNQTLYQMAQGSGLNLSSFNECMSNATSTLDGEATLAAFYNITTVPTYILDCKYQTVPYSAQSAINYLINTTNTSSAKHG